MRIQGAIFDMDGLMLDSEILYEQASLHVMAGMGVEPSLEVIHKSIGLPEPQWAMVVKEHYGEDFDLGVYQSRCSEEMRIWYEEKKIPTKPGLFELLDYLRDKNIACAVASSTYKAKAMKSLEGVGAAKYFSAFIFGDMIERGKPAPDIFLAAAKALALPSSCCMGLEDSFNGIRACRSAGLYTVMVPDLLTPTEEILSLTDNCVKSLLDVIPIFESLNG